MISSVMSNRAAVLVAAFIGVLLAVLPAVAGAQFQEEQVRKFAVAITNAAHPTAKKAALVKYSEPKEKKDGFILIKMELEYYGAVSKNRYTADALLEIQLPKKLSDALEITRIDFVDNNNSLPADQKNLKKLIEEMNRRFRVENAK